MNETCFVTGGSGFIGQHLVALLTSKGHPTWVLMRRPQELSALREKITRLGGNSHLLNAVAGDLTSEGLGLSESDLLQVSKAKVVFHLGAQFSWGMSREQAHAVNVAGALRVAELAARQRSRLLMVGGYMLENHQHLHSVGVDLQMPGRTDWVAVYSKVGGYEGSKLEAHFAVLERMHALGGELTIVHPATVCGHSRSGHIVAGQPLAEIIRNLADGKLSVIPGSPRHWLPLVCVDFLVGLMVAAAFDPSQVGRQLLALDEQTPNLQGMLGLLAESLGRRAPRRHMPIRLLRLLLKIPSLAGFLRTNAESLDFIQVTRFDTHASQELATRHRLHTPDIREAINATARFVMRG